MVQMVYKCVVFTGMTHTLLALCSCTCATHIYCTSFVTEDNKNRAILRELKGCICHSSDTYDPLIPGSFTYPVSPHHRWMSTAVIKISFSPIPPCPFDSALPRKLKRQQLLTSEANSYCLIAFGAVLTLPVEITSGALSRPLMRDLNLR